MVRIAREKLRSQRGPEPRVVDAERLGELAKERDAAGVARFDGAFSNFAALNCVDALDTFGAGLARLLRPGSPALLVLFGTLCPGELVVQIARGRVGLATRRRERVPVAARLGGSPVRLLRHHLRAHRPGRRRAVALLGRRPDRAARRHAAPLHRPPVPPSGRERRRARRVFT